MSDSIKSITGFLSQATADTALRIIGALVMLVIGFFVIKHIMHLLEKSMTRSKLDLALQGGLGNFAGRLMLLVFHPFRVGDYIKSDTVEGSVVSMNIMYTQLATFDKKKVIVPNSTLSNGVVTNFSAFDTRRVDLSFTLPSDADIEAVKALMNAQATGHPLVLDTPAPDARMGSVQGGQLVFTLRCWCKTLDF